MVGRLSSSAPVSLSEPSASVHSSNGRLVVTRIEPLSYLWLKTSKSSSAPVLDRGIVYLAANPTFTGQPGISAYS